MEHNLAGKHNLKRTILFGKYAFNPAFINTLTITAFLHVTITSNSVPAQADQATEHLFHLRKQVGITATNQAKSIAAVLGGFMFSTNRCKLQEKPTPYIQPRVFLHLTA